MTDTIFEKMTSIADAIREKNGKTELLTLDDMAQQISLLTDLDFNIVGGSTQPSNPAENTIWINTNTTIPGWYFSAEQPSSSTSGKIWFYTDAPSAIEFNALKNNSIIVYPVSAKQYINSRWTSVNMQIYQGGKWVETLYYLYHLGDQCTSVTGGWLGLDNPNSSYDKITVTNKSDHLEIYALGYNVKRWAYAKNSIDLTNYNTITLDGYYTSSAGTASLIVAKDITSGYAGSVSLSKSRKNHSINISQLSGEYIVAIEIAAGSGSASYADSQATAYMYNLYLE